MTRAFVVLSLLFVLLATVCVAADESPTPEECVAAYEGAQKHRNELRLVEAAQALSVCSAASCPELMVDECATWHEEVQRDTPTVRIAATRWLGTAGPRRGVAHRRS